MGPNLTRLFAEAQVDVFCEDGDSDRLGILLYRHGEALIAALEGVLDPKNHGGFTIANERAKALLAKLEQEAQP